MKNFAKLSIRYILKRNFSLPTILLLSTLYLLPTTTLSFAQSGWGPDTQLVYMQGGGWYPRAACCGDTIHLVWWQAYTAHDEVFYKRSTDAGATWGEDVMLSVEDDKSSTLPTIGVNGDFIHVVWTEQNIGVCYRKSTNGGNSWHPIDTLPNAGLSVPWIHVDGFDLYVIAGAGTGFQMLTKSTDNGNTWQSGQPVAHSCGGARLIKIDTLLLVMANPDNPYCVEIFCLRSFDNGQSWVSECISYYDSAGSQHPAMDTDDSGGIHITWYDYKYSPYPWTGDIFYRVSRDSGNTWEEIDSLTVMHRAIASDILAEGNNLHLVWEDDRNGFDDNFEIYYRMSTDLGRTWGQEVRLTNAINHSKCPSLACDGRYLHLFWYDLRDDTSNIVGEIYYKRKDLLAGKEETKYSRVNGTGLSLDCPTILMEKTEIHYNLGKNRDGVLSIIDVTGRVIKNFPVHNVSGELVIPFNKEVQDGVYFIMLKSGSDYITRKVLVVR